MDFQARAVSMVEVGVSIEEGRMNMDSTPPAQNPLSPDSLEFRSIDVTYVAELQGLPLTVWFKFGKLLRLPSNGGFFSSTTVHRSHL